MPATGAIAGRRSQVSAGRTLAYAADASKELKTISIFRQSAIRCCLANELGPHICHISAQISPVRITALNRPSPYLRDSQEKSLAGAERDRSELRVLLTHPDEYSAFYGKRDGFHRIAKGSHPTGYARRCAQADARPPNVKTITAYAPPNSRRRRSVGTISGVSRGEDISAEKVSCPDSDLPLASRFSISR